MYTKKTNLPRIINSLSRKGTLVTILAFALLLSPMVAYGATFTIAWDANTEADLAGYKIHYGTASHNYSQSIDVGNTTQFTLVDLNDGVTYYIAATAYDDDTNESAYSVELVHTTGNPTHIITASAGANGSISPSGSLTVTMDPTERLPSARMRLTIFRMFWWTGSRSGRFLPIPLSM